jgi:uncharacterized membrane protein
MILAGIIVGLGVFSRSEEVEIGYSVELQWSPDWRICISIVYRYGYLLLGAASVLWGHVWLRRRRESRGI